MLIDITIPLKEGLAVWPGDTAFSLTQSAWGQVTVGAATMSLHTGTHADAPRHFLPPDAGGRSIAQCGLAAFFGPCVVVEAMGRDSIGPEVLPAALPPRVLFKTLAWTDHGTFPESVPTLLPETVAVLERAGVVLVGVDVPSVDAIDSKELPIHHALTGAGIRILESLDLRRAAPGEYELIALPLPFVDGDASPVRAILDATDFG